MSLQGQFYNVAGLHYESGRVKGITTTDYKFSYESGEVVKFFIGDLMLGECKGKHLITISDLAAKQSVDFDPGLVNRARLLYSLSSAQGSEKPVMIDEKTRNAVGKFSSSIDFDSPILTSLDTPLQGICQELGWAPKSVSHTCNHLRREASGFSVLRDISVPTQDGNYVLADVYLPLAHQLGEKYPALISCTLYGRRIFHSGPDLTLQSEIDAFEKAEDDWHSKSSDTPITLPRESWGLQWDKQRGFENIATFNTFTYVPQGYAMVKVDPRGVSQTPGIRGVPGQITADFYDATEWTAQQDWCDGAVALVGSSYGANTQWEVANLKPKGLRCFVPYATDIDMYRDAAFPGGIPTERYISDWFARVQRSSPGKPNAMNLVDVMKANPFYNGLWDMISTKLLAPDVPCFLAASQIFIIHGRGAHEAWRLRNPENTHLQLVDCNYYSWPSREASRKVLQFLDHHLKGSAYPQLERVGIQVRLGDKAWYWRKEKDWPVPGTQYKRFHLDHGGSLSEVTSTGPEERLTYSSLAPKSGKSGLSFHSAPFTEDIEFAGYFSAVLSFSSSARDADVVVTLWAVNEEGSIVRYGHKGEHEPLAKGFLRASHRKLDPSNSLPERPLHTHKEEDIALLHPEEVVQLDVEIFPAAGRLQRGWKLRVDITPSEDQPEIDGYAPPEMRVWYGEDQTDGKDTIHIGQGFQNFIQCPVVPVKNGYPNLIM